MLINRAEIAGQLVDLRVDSTILEIGSLTATPGETVLDAAGGAVIPGLHDHHVHLRSMAAALGSILATEDALRKADRDDPPGEWLRAIDSSDPHLDRHRLDEIVTDRPVRVQHRSGVLWTVNSAAIRELDIGSSRLPGVERDHTDSPTGRLWRMDDWLREAIGVSPTDLAAISCRAVGHGVTGFTDATPGRTQADIDEFNAAGMAQRLVLMAPPGRTTSGRVELGPTKIVLDDTTLPDIDDLAAALKDIDSAGKRPAIHCVTAEQLIVATASLSAAGVSGARIEHAGVVPPGYADVMRDLAVTVVTQPAFIGERGDSYLTDVSMAEQQWLYPCASLQRAGVAVAGSTDAPFTDADPWRSIQAATTRRTPSGQLIGPSEALDHEAALALFLGDPHEPGRIRAIEVGSRAELCVLAVSIREASNNPTSEHVAGVVMNGRFIHR